MIANQPVKKSGHSKFAEFSKRCGCADRTTFIKAIGMTSHAYTVVRTVQSKKKRNSTRDVILGNTAKRKRIRYRFGIPSKSLSGFRSTRGRGIANPFLFIVQELRLLLQFITANALSEISTFYPWNQLCSGCICVVLDTAEFYRRNKSVLFRDGRCG